MEERQKKFVCKYCLKRFPCGKSLGGHIRTHMTEERTNAAAIAAAIADDAAHIFKKRDAEHVAAAGGGGGGGGGGDGGNTIYGLRENPKKTMRFVHSHHHAAGAGAATTLEYEMIKFCKECGKGFPSLKALCGHMASHSEKDKRRLIMEDDDDTDDVDDDDACVAATTMNLRKSKRRIRFKSLTLTNHQPSSSSVNGSSSVSEMEQEQQEEVARCLMLLSRDFFSHKGRFVSESCDDNNEVVLETKSKIVIRNGSKFVANTNGHEFVEEKKKLKSVGGIGVSNNSDSRDFKIKFGVSNNSKKIKFVDSSVSNYEFKRPKVEEDKSRFEDCRSKYNVMLKKSDMMNKDLDHDSKFDLRKKSNYEGFGFSNKNEEIYENGSKSLKYEYFESEKDNGNFYDSITDVESDEENSSESDSFPAAKSHNSKAVNRKKLSSNKGKKKKKLKSKKSKEYECPICYKIFRSGQALGGHKRSHFVGGSEDNTFVIKQAAAAAPAAPCLLDLNLPAPVDE